MQLGFYMDRRKISTNSTSCDMLRIGQILFNYRWLLVDEDSLYTSVSPDEHNGMVVVSLYTEVEE